MIESRVKGNCHARFGTGENLAIISKSYLSSSWEMVIAGMELKRIGKIQKPMYVVPANILTQFQKDFQQAYNQANLLVLRTEDLPFVKPDIEYDEKFSDDKKEKSSTKELTKFENKRLSAEKNSKRRATLSRIATEDWDAIIISHDTFGRLPVSVDLINEFYWEQIDALEAEFEDAYYDALRKWEDGESFSKPSRTDFEKQKARKIKALEKKMAQNREKDMAKEIIMPFEELGIDMLFVDEAHHFKNLEFPTLLQIKGVSSNGSDRARDMYLKTRWLNKQRNGGGIVFASGTPISNTLNEIYTWQRYLGYNTLEEEELLPFSSWAGVYGEKVRTVELGADGGGYRPVEKLNLANATALRNITAEFFDVKMEADLPYLKRPALRGGDFHRIIVKPTQAQLDKMKELAERHEAIHKGGVDPAKDNALKITGETRAASLDMRLLDPTTPESEAGNKIPAVCDNVWAKYQETNATSGAQVVFLNLGTPQAGSKRKKSNDENSADNDNSNETVENALSENDLKLYDIIKAGLIKRGIPANQIAFVHDAGNKPEARKALFDAVNAGEIRVILGLILKMGEGVNMQKKLAAAHLVDCPWRPTDIKQGMGRILRAGNENAEVEIFQYIIEDTGDSFLWEKIGNKSEMTDNFMRGKNVADKVEETGEFTLSANESKMLALGSKETRERAEVALKIQSLKLAQAAYLQQQTAFQDDKTKLENKISVSESKIKNLKADVAEKIDTKGDSFQMKIGDTVYTKRTDAAPALANAIKNFTSTAPAKIGEIGGFDLKAPSEVAYTSQNGKETTTVNRVVLQLSNHGNYTVNDSIQSVEHFISKGIETLLADMENFLAQDKSKLAEIIKKLAVPFDRQAEFEAALKRLAEIDKEIFKSPEERKLSAEEEAFEKFSDGVAEWEAEIENKNSYAEIVNNFPDVRWSTDKNNHTGYTIDGKRASQDDARKVAKQISNAKRDFILESLKNDTGITSKDFVSDGNNIYISFEQGNKFILANNATFDTFEEAVKAARYIKENFDDIDFINVSTDGRRTVFRINDNDESFETDETREKIAKMDAAQNENAPTENKNSYSEIESQLNQSLLKNNSLFKIGEFKHTKTGKLIPSAELTTHVDNFSELKTLAKKHNGYYSSFAKSFLFDTKKDRDSFIEESSASNENVPAENQVQAETASEENFNAETESNVPAESENNSEQDIFEYSNIATNGLSDKKFPAVSLKNYNGLTFDRLEPVAKKYNGSAVYHNDKYYFTFANNEDRENFEEAAQVVLSRFETEDAAAQSENITRWQDLSKDEQLRRGNISAEYKNLKLDAQKRNLLRKSYPEIYGWIDELVNFANQYSNGDRYQESFANEAKKRLASYLKFESILPKAAKFESAVKDMYDMWERQKTMRNIELSPKNLEIQKQAIQLIEKLDFREITPADAYTQMKELLGKKYNDAELAAQLEEGIPEESEKVSDDEKSVEAEKPPQELIKPDNAAISKAYKSIFAVKRGPGISTTETVENGNFITDIRDTTAKRSLGYYKLGKNSA